MKDALYIKFLRRLHQRCQRYNGKVDIREMVANDLCYDACYSFMQWAEQDGICRLSVIYDNIIIWLNPIFMTMNEQEFYKFIRKC